MLFYGKVQNTCIHISGLVWNMYRIRIYEDAKNGLFYLDYYSQKSCICMIALSEASYLQHKVFKNVFLPCISFRNLEYCSLYTKKCLFWSNYRDTCFFIFIALLSLYTGSGKQQRRPYNDKFGRISA